MTDGVIPGLRYVRGYIDEAEHDGLLTTVCALPWVDVQAHRRMQFYGYTHDYPSRSIKRTGKLPPWARRIARRIHDDGLSPRVPQQLAVNSYEPGQGIFTPSTRTSSTRSSSSAWDRRA